MCLLEEDRFMSARDREPTVARLRRTELILKVFALLALALGAVAMPFAAQSPGPIPNGFTRIFNGKDLPGGIRVALPITARRHSSR